MLKKLLVFIFCTILILSTSLQTVHASTPRIDYFNTYFTFSSFDELSSEFSDKGTDMFYELLEENAEQGAKYEKHRKFELYKLFPQQTYIPYFCGETIKLTKDIVVDVDTGINYFMDLAETCVFNYTIELTSTDGFIVLAEIKVNHLPKDDWDNVYNTCLDKVANFSSEYSKIHSVNLGGEEYQSDFGDICVYEAYTRANSDGINGSKYYIFGMTDRKTYITVQFLDNPLYENSELRENTGYTVPQEFLGNIDWLSKLTFKKHEFNDTKPMFKVIEPTILNYAFLEMNNAAMRGQYNISVIKKDHDDSEYKKVKELLNDETNEWYSVYTVTADEEGKKILKEPQWTVFNRKSSSETHAFKLTDDDKLEEMEFITYDDFTIIDIDEPGIYAFVKMDNDEYSEFIGENINDNTINNGSMIYIVIISIMAAIIVAGVVVVVLLLRKRKLKKED